MKNMLPRQSGFTLIEIIFTLIILGVLATVANHYFFDLRSDAEEKLAKATVDATQVKINSRFQKLMMYGADCKTALSEVNRLELLADDGKNAFGDFYFSLAGNAKVITTEGVSVTAHSKTSNHTYASIATLQVPLCFGVDNTQTVPQEIPTGPTTEPGNPQEDIHGNGLVTLDDLQHKRPSPEVGLVFIDEKTGKLYVCLVSEGKFGKGQRIEKLLRQGKVAPLNMSQYAIYDNGSWDQTIKKGTLVKVEGQVYVYTGDSTQPLPPYEAGARDWYPVQLK